MRDISDEIERLRANLAHQCELNDAAVEENEQLRTRLSEAEALLREAHDHLEYCGYGDSWERECARESKLPERLDAFLGRKEP